MIVSTLLVVLVVAVGVLAGYAIYKYGTAAAVETAVKAEVAKLETLASKVDLSVKADYTAAIKRIKAIF
jgi:hypothetical protein